LNARRLPAARWLLSCLLLGSGVASAEGALTLEQLRGREIYRRGQLAETAVGTAAVGVDGVPLSTSSFPCANCHGIYGEGDKEGGIAAPPLDWKRLTEPAVSTVTNRHRSAYTGNTLRRAITEGLDPGQRRLHPSMPRFVMPDARLAELTAYLERIGDDEDLDPGVSVRAIRIGAALPLSGPLATAGAAVRETLERAFADASRDNGIYGRRIELVVADSRGDAAGLREATRSLIDRGDVFALVASFAAGSGREDGERRLQAAGMPLVGPIALSPHQTGVPNPYVFYLLPSLHDQARALVDHIAAHSAVRQPRIAVIHAGNAENQAVMAGLRRQAAVREIEIVAEERDSPSGVAAVLAKRPGYVIYAGDGTGLGRIAAALDHGDSARAPGNAPILASFISTAESAVAGLPPRVASRALFVAPALPPDARQAAAFFATLPPGDAPLTFPGLRVAAFASATVLVEALRKSGKRLSRPGFLRTLERLQHFETGVTQPITFGPNRRNGNMGGAILAFDPRQGRFSVKGGWLTPKDPVAPKD
jgi:ABC-type branched-subunit amino acid transport system substrate-binding protein